MAAAVGWRSTSLHAGEVGILVDGIEGSSLLRLLVLVDCSNLGRDLDLERGWVGPEGRDPRPGGREVGRKEAGIPAGVRLLDGLRKGLGMSGDIRFWTWW